MHSSKRFNLAASRQSVSFTVANPNDSGQYELPNYEQAISASSVTDAESLHRRTGWPTSTVYSEDALNSPGLVDPTHRPPPPQVLARRPLPQPNPGSPPQQPPAPSYGHGNGHTSTPSYGSGSSSVPSYRNSTPSYERYVYRYRLVAGGTPIMFLISVEPQNGRPTPGKYTFRLSFKTNGVERPLCEPVERYLAVKTHMSTPHGLDPRSLDFIVFVFPGKTSLPAGCLWSVRVWLRADGIEHRLFGDDELWVGKDPDFNSIGDASFARPKAQDSREQVYSAFVGRALVNFVFRWECVTGTLYRYSMDYEAGGVGANLFEDFRLRVDGDPRNIGFLVFTVPSNSIPAGASHKLRVWLRTPTPLPRDPNTSYVLPFNESYIYQRIWKTDDFKLGAHLRFEDLGPKCIMGFGPQGGPETVVLAHAPHLQSGSGSEVGRGRASMYSIAEGGKKDGAGYDF